VKGTVKDTSDARHHGDGGRSARRTSAVACACLVAGLVIAWSPGVVAGTGPAKFKVVNLDRRTTTGTQVITHNLGVAATAVLMWTANRPGLAWAVNYQLGIGMTDFTTSRSLSIAADATDNRRKRIDTVLFHLVNSSGTVVVSGALGTGADAPTPNAFTINWTVVDGVAAKMHYAVMAGAQTKAKVLSWQAPNGTNATYPVNGVGFKPTTVLHFVSGFSVTAAPPVTANDAELMIGAMDRAGNQWITALIARNTLPAAYAFKYHSFTPRSLELWEWVGTTASPAVNTKKIATFVNMHSDGFTLNFSASDTSQSQIVSLALQGLNQQVGSLIKTSGTDQPVVTTGWKPGLLLMAGWQRTAPANDVSVSNNVEFSLGASDGTTHGSSAISEVAGADPPNNDSIENNTRCFMRTLGATTVTQATVVFNATNFDLTWSAADAQLTQIRYLALGAASPTAVKLDGFAAREGPGGTVVSWRTGFEVDNLGFYLSRERAGVRTRVSPDLIAGSALFAGEGTALSAGRSYAYRVRASEPGSRYWLEEVDLGGKSLWHGPITASAAPADASEVAEVEKVRAPLLKELRDPPDLGRGSDPTPGLNVLLPRPSRLAAAADHENQWQLAARPGIKITIDQDGLYRLTREELAATGLAGAGDLGGLRLYTDGQEVPLGISADGNAVELYATGADTVHSNRQVYWLVAGEPGGRRTSVLRDDGPATPATSFPFTTVQKERSIYFAALRNGDSENFFGPVVAVAPVERTVRLHHLAADASGMLQVSLQGVTLGQHHVAVTFNGSPLATVELTGQELRRLTLPLPAGRLREGDNSITLASSDAADVTMLESLQLTWDHSFTADGGALRFLLPQGKSAKVGGFSSGAVRAFDVTDPREVRELAAHVTADGSAEGSAEEGLFRAMVSASSSARAVLLIEPDRIAPPPAMVLNSPSSWNRDDNAADLVVIAHRSLMDSMRPLADLRRSQGHEVALVDVEDIYDELSFGHKTPWAIRDFLLRARSTWTKAPHFVLLVGDATLDPRNYLGQGDFDQVPTKLLDSSLLETASDDWFADFHGTGIPAMAIGRLPARSPAQADIMVRKILAAERPADSGNQVVILTGVSDAENDFEASGREASAAVTSPFMARTLMRSSLDGPAFKQALLAALEAGPVLVDYLGHGSQSTWPGLLDASDASLLKNGDRPSIFVNMTCLNGFFQDVAAPSLAEAVISVPGGPAGVWASSGLTPLDPQITPNNTFLEAALARGLTLGDAAIAAKAATTDDDIRRTWILFGDPSSKLRRPPASPPPGRGNPSCSPSAGPEGNWSCDLAAPTLPGGTSLLVLMAAIAVVAARRSSKRRSAAPDLTGPPERRR
jgi:hypothetical protein